MKKIKLNILQSFILLFSLSTFIYSCSSDNESQIENEPTSNKSNTLYLREANNFNTSENKEKLVALLEDETEANNIFNEYYADFVNDWDLNNPNLTSEEKARKLLNQYTECDNCSESYKEFLVPMFEEMIITQNNQIVSLLDEYQVLLKSKKYDLQKENDLTFVIYSLQVSASSLAAKETPIGTSIGQGLVTGFVVGCIRGAVACGVAGTMALPVIGTVTGAVACCIGNGAVTGVITAAASGFWNWINS